MVRRYILDCLRFWVQRYGVDGFRFDLAGLMDRGTVAAIAEAFPDRYLYGEPWAASGALWGKGDVNELDPWAVFDDDFRDAVKGSTEGTDGGFIQGRGGLGRVQAAVTGNTIAFGGAHAWADSPTDGLLYMDAHDNLTLADKLEVSLDGLTLEEKRARVRLGGAVTLTSLGPVMLHAGVEMLRSKPYGEQGDGRPIQDRDSETLFDANSYSSSDTTNNLNWNDKAEHYSVFTYFQGLIALRLGELGLPSRPPAAVEEGYFEWHTDDDNPQALGYTLNADRSNGGRRLRVLLNPDAEAQAAFAVQFDAQQGWRQVADSLTVDLLDPQPVPAGDEVVVEPLGIRIYADGF